MKYGPSIVTNGCVLALDAADRNSYPGSGTTWYDLSGNGNHGTLTNGPTFNSGNGGDIVLDGTDDYIKILDDGKSTVFDTQSYTIESVFYANIGNFYGALWSFDYTSHVDPFYSQQFRHNSGNQLFFSWNDGTTYRYILADVGSLNNWSVATAVFTYGYQAIYLNGALVASSARNDIITYYNQEIWIGKMNFASGLLSGGIVSAKFYNRALSASEILQNYNATKSRFGL